MLDKSDKPIKPVAITNKRKKEVKNLTPPKGICGECGSGFSQDWNSGTGLYSSFKLCPECRISTAKKEEAYKIRLDYTPHPFQRLVHESSARFKVVCAGARGGKDFCLVTEFFLKLMICANEERPTSMVPRVLGWIIAPTEKLARQNWRDLKRVVPKKLIVDESRSTGQMTLRNGVLIELHSAYNPEDLVAVGVDVALITEAARIKDMQVVWENLEMRLNSPGRGVEGKGGIGLINSSPLGKNFFYKMWLWGRPESDTYDSDWESFRWTTWDNPYMAIRADDICPKTGLTYKERMKRRYSKVRYEQDIEAKFLSDESSVFSEFEENCLEQIPKVLDGRPLKGKARDEYIRKWREPNPYKEYTVGYDPASINDEPIVWIIENDTGKLMKAVTLRGLGWDGQFDAIAMYSKKYNHAVVSFGRTGHETVDSQLIKRGLVTNPLNEQGANKANLVENLSRVVESRLLRVLDDGEEITETIKLQFNDYTRVFNKGGNVTYGNATNSSHDDHVSAAYFAFANLDTTIEKPMPYVGLVGVIGR